MSREGSVQRTTRRAARQLRALGEELREARLSAGIRQAELARVTGVRQAKISEIESGAATNVRAWELAVIAGCVGLELSMRLFPAGPPLRDRAHLALLKRFRARVSSDLGWQLEAPMPIQGDLRGIDVLLRNGKQSAGVEVESRLRDVQTVIRRVELKQRDAGLDAMVLLLGASKFNREAVRGAEAMLRATFPLRTRDVLRALARGDLPGANGIVVI